MPLAKFTASVCGEFNYISLHYMQGKIVLKGVLLAVQRGWRACGKLQSPEPILFEQNWKNTVGTSCVSCMEQSCLLPAQCRLRLLAVQGLVDAA